MMIALYARVSTTDQDAQMQMTELRRVAEARGWTDVVEYVDTGSGAAASLPRRDALIADAAQGKVEMVVVWKFDRFARSTSRLVEALENFRAWGVDFISLHEGIDTSTPAGKMVFTMIAAIAEFERDTIRERVRAGIANAQEHGTKTGRPIGRPRVEVDVDRVRALRDAGTSWRKISKDMGIPVSTIRGALDRA